MTKQEEEEEDEDEEEKVEEKDLNLYDLIDYHEEMIIQVSAPESRKKHWEALKVRSNRGTVGRRRILMVQARHCSWLGSFALSKISNNLIVSFRLALRSISCSTIR